MNLPPASSSQASSRFSRASAGETRGYGPTKAIIGPITANVTEDYNADTRAKIFGKLRREAVKLGADAVVMVTKGISR